MPFFHSSPMQRLILFLFLLSGTMFSPVVLGGPSSSAWNSLSSAEHERLASGKPLVVEEEIPGNPWPRFTIYQLVKASPAQVAAVFWDCEKDPEYVPNCTKVTILNRPTPNVVEAEYTLKMPFFLPDEVYVSRNELIRVEEGSYVVNWRVQRSHYTKACSGTLKLEDHDGDTLIRYSNLVEPGSRIAKLMKASASRQVVESVQSLVDRVGDLLIRPGNSLEKQVRHLEEALGITTSSGASR
jgi:ribosome-associated toxin RatA of RatAB toxin-antitoxin module